MERFTIIGVLTQTRSLQPIGECMRRRRPNLAAAVDPPTRVCLRWLRLGRRATEQRRWAEVYIL